VGAFPWCRRLWEQPWTPANLARYSVKSPAKKVAIWIQQQTAAVEQCRKCEFRSKRHVLRRQIRDLHRSAAEISSFSLPAAVSRGEIDFRLRAGGISPSQSLGFRIATLKGIVSKY
jgi:hypothetical protein